MSLGLLMMVKKDLLAQDFEGIMKYFRVNIPKRLRWIPWIITSLSTVVRSEEHAKTLMKTVVGIKIKNLSKYEKDWRRKKEAERLAEDPVTRWRKTKNLMEMTKDKSQTMSLLDLEQACALIFYRTAPLCKLSRRSVQKLFKLGRLVEVNWKARWIQLNWWKIKARWKLSRDKKRDKLDLIG